MVARCYPLERDMVVRQAAWMAQLEWGDRATCEVHHLALEWLQVVCWLLADRSGCRCDDFRNHGTLRPTGITRDDIAHTSFIAPAAPARQAALTSTYVVQASWFEPFTLASVKGERERGRERIE